MATKKKKTVNTNPTLAELNQRAIASKKEAAASMAEAMENPAGAIKAARESEAKTKKLLHAATEEIDELKTEGAELRAEIAELKAMIEEPAGVAGESEAKTD